MATIFRPCRGWARAWKRQQAKFAELTLTDMYNVLEKLRAGEREIVNSELRMVKTGEGRISDLRSQKDRPVRAPAPLGIQSAAFSPKEKQIHDRGLVAILKQLHEELDGAVFAAYGWEAGMSEEELLEKLVGLNRERAAEEKRGVVRYLRPEFQVGAKGRGK